jgi:hypothetical protein
MLQQRQDPTPSLMYSSWVVSPTVLKMVLVDTTGRMIKGMEANVYREQAPKDAPTTNPGSNLPIGSIYTYFI